MLNNETWKNLEILQREMKMNICKKMIELENEKNGDGEYVRINGKLQLRKRLKLKNQHNNPKS